MDTFSRPPGGLRRGGGRQLATSLSGQKVDTDSLRPPSIVVPDPSRTRSLLDELADVGLASRRALGDDGCSTAVGLVQAPSLQSSRSDAFLSSSKERSDDQSLLSSDVSPLPLKT